MKGEGRRIKSEKSRERRPGASEEYTDISVGLSPVCMLFIKQCEKLNSTWKRRTP